MIQTITIPEIGEKVESGKVVGILVSVGDWVEQDDGIIEFETEKAVVEIPSPAKGRIAEILVREGDELNIGDGVATLETGAEASPAEPAASVEDAPQEESDTVSAHHKSGAAPVTGGEGPAAGAGELLKKDRETERPTGVPPLMPVPAAPSVRRFARELGVDLREVQGSGPGGRISEQDVKHFLKKRGPSTAPGEPASFPGADQETDLPDFRRWGEIEVVEMSTVRRITADSMSQSWRIAPHVTQFDTADITSLNEWLQNAGPRAAKAGTRLTITAVVIKVTAECLTRFPYFNASMDRRTSQIILKQYVHVGMAVETDRGLLVPVIRHADKKSILDIAAEIEDLSSRARSKRLNPDEMEGGTFTVSNQGGIGGVNFTPIVYWPQAAILGVSRGRVEPRYLDEQWEPRSMLPLSLSYDHRINDGAQAARFLRWICEALEYPFNMFT